MPLPRLRLLPQAVPRKKKKLRSFSDALKINLYVGPSRIEEPNREMNQAQIELSVKARGAARACSGYVNDKVWLSC